MTCHQLDPSARLGWLRSFLIRRPRVCGAVRCKLALPLYEEHDIQLIEVKLLIIAPFALAPRVWRAKVSSGMYCSAHIV